MSTPIGHIVSIAAVRATSQPIARAWCSCGWEWRCSSGATHLAFSKGEEHVIQETLTPRKNSQWGHLSVQLCGGGIQRSTLIHRLVMESFVGPAPEGTIVCHNDGDPTNNRLENLRYSTPSENMYDRTLHGTDPNALRTHCKHGHLLMLPNLTVAPWRKRGWRVCLACNRARGYLKGHPELIPSFQAVADSYYRDITTERAAS